MPEPNWPRLDSVANSCAVQHEAKKGSLLTHRLRHRHRRASLIPLNGRFHAFPLVAVVGRQPDDVQPTRMAGQSVRKAFQ